MNLHHDPVRADGSRRICEGRYQRPLTRRVRGVDDDRQVGPASQHRHRTQVERIAGRGLERTDAPLTQEHLLIALRQDVLGCLQEFVQRRTHPPFQHHRSMLPADG